MQLIKLLRIHRKFCFFFLFFSKLLGSKSLAKKFSLLFIMKKNRKLIYAMIYLCIVYIKSQVLTLQIEMYFLIRIYNSLNKLYKQNNFVNERH